MKIMNLLAAVVFIVGASAVAAQNISKCIDILITPDPGVPYCDSVESAIKCIIRELGAHNDLLLSPTFAKDLEDQLNSQFNILGISCSVDVDDLLEEVRREEQNETLPVTTVQPTESGFEGATTLGDCISELTKATLKAGGITCPLASQYTKCTLRVLDFLATNPTPQDIQDFEDILEEELEKQGIVCDLDVPSIIVELLAEQNATPTPTTPSPSSSSASSASTTAAPPTPSPTTPTPVTPTPVTVATGLRGCVVNDPVSGCLGRNNGDYAVCDRSQCDAGKYITCSNNNLYVMNCPFGWYVDNGSRFAAPMVFNPPTNTCERRSVFCPRSLDRFVEE